MPTIYLNQTSTYQTQSSRSSESVNVSVAHQPYQISNLFKRYKHEPKNDKTGIIKVYKSMSDFGGLSIRPDKEHASKQLQHAYVYFNQFDKNHSNPLLLSLHFENDKKEEKYKYFQYTEIKSYFSSRRQANTSDMDGFTNYQDLNRTLIYENYNANNSLIYLLNKKGQDHNGSNYNSGAISISKKEQISNDQSNEFSKYTHTPKSGAKKSYFLYNMNVLNKINQQPLEEIQGQVYSSLVVYFGTRAKNLSRTNRDIPLLIELTKKTTPRDPDYYVHKKNSDGYYWENLKDTISDLLTDIGLSTSVTGRGYDQLKGILRKATLSQGSENDLNVKLKRATGSKLQRLLSHKIPEDDRGVSSQKSLLTLLLRQIEFELVDSLIILLDKKSSSTYEESEVQRIIGNLQPKREFNRIKMTGKNISVTDQTEQKAQCVNNHKYRVYEHNFSTLVSDLGNSAFAIRFIIPSKSSATEYKQLSLHSTIGLQAEPQNIEYIYYQNNGPSTSNSDKVYVWFYDGTKGSGKGDPRPLMVCYNNTTYAPKDKESYFTQWVKVNELANGTIKDCGCSQNQGVQVQETENKLLQQLDKVVKFLNKVELKPVGSNGTSGTHKYEVQTFKGQKIQINVECSTVGNSSGSPPLPSPGTCSTSPSSSCYKKFVHKPAGIEGGQANGSGFRLGEIEHNGTSGGSKSTLNYADLNSTNSYEPLISVTVYYYEHDKNFTDPLLIELDFKVDSGRGDTTILKEYYKLQPRNGSGGSGTLQWKKDDDAQDKMGTDNTAVEHLDGIRYSLKKLLKIYIEKQIQYDLCLSNQAGESASTYGPERDNKIQVSECTQNGGCSQLATLNYKCYQHKVSNITGGFDYNSIGGLKFYISGTAGNDVEIPLHDEEQSKINQITYNKCMGDVYVYFYAKHSTKSADDVPLMLRYNGGYYRPEERDDYFVKWSYQSGLERLKTPCGSVGDEGEESGDNYELLAGMLDVTNKELNRIYLTKTSNYGIPTQAISPPKTPAIDVNRVDVTKIPNKDPTNMPYLKIVHRTSNGFTIGEIWYGVQDILAGVKINNGGGGNITVDSPDHTTNFVNPPGDNKPNTVVAYYHTEDNEYKLPQLIVLMTTDQPIDDRQYNITASNETRYGYYILVTRENGSKYHYEWRTVEDTSADSPFELNDETELSLLNSVVILVEQKPNSAGSTTDKYGDEKIQPLVQALVQSGSLTKSPGLPNDDINRLKGKDITLTDVTTQAQGLDQTGFIAIKHDLSKIVDPKIKGADVVTLIAILRFLIPTQEGGGEYKTLTLINSEVPNIPVTLFHQKTQDSVYVYFYDPNKDGKGDPRPLLLCYNKQAFRALTIDEYDEHKWKLISGSKDCINDGRKLLAALSYVSNFLNPLNIKMVNDGSYKVHKFNGQDINIKVTGKSGSDGFCYTSYTHKHEKTGFRLGRIDYGSDTRGTRSGKCIQLSNHDSSSSNGDGTCINAELDDPRDKSLSASQVVVYYYGGDKKHKNPLLVVLCSENNENVSKQYYELQRSDDTTTKMYAKQSINLKLDTSKNGQLEQILDKILYYISKSLLIDLGFRARTEVQYPGKIGEQNKIIKHDKYSARVYENEFIKPVKTAAKIEIQVSGPTDISDASGKKTGYQCYKHKLTSIEDISQINGIRLFLWDNRDSGDGDESQCKGPKAKFLPKRSCCEITLFKRSSFEDVHYFELPYTTCKGDLYVYFYGSDPRPMLLCYNIPNIIQAF